MRASETSTGRGSVSVQGDGQPMLSIVVPAFNEAARIGNSIHKIDEHVPIGELETLKNIYRRLLIQLAQN